jgi:hypothetical protein
MDRGGRSARSARDKKKPWRISRSTAPPGAAVWDVRPRTERVGRQETLAYNQATAISLGEFSVRGVLGRQRGAASIAFRRLISPPERAGNPQE